MFRSVNQINKVNNLIEPFVVEMYQYIKPENRASFSTFCENLLAPVNKDTAEIHNVLLKRIVVPEKIPQMNILVDNFIAEILNKRQEQFDTIRRQTEMDKPPTEKGLTLDAFMVIVQSCVITRANMLITIQPTQDKLKEDAKKFQNAAMRMEHLYQNILQQLEQKEAANAQLLEHTQKTRLTTAEETASAEKWKLRAQQLEAALLESERRAAVLTYPSTLITEADALSKSLKKLWGDFMEKCKALDDAQTALNKFLDSSPSQLNNKEAEIAALEKKLAEVEKELDKIPEQLKQVFQGKTADEILDLPAGEQEQIKQARVAVKEREKKLKEEQEKLGSQLANAKSLVRKNREDIKDFAETKKRRQKDVKDKTRSKDKVLKEYELQKKELLNKLVAFEAACAQAIAERVNESDAAEGEQFNTEIYTDAMLTKMKDSYKKQQNNIKGFLKELQSLEEWFAEQPGSHYLTEAKRPQLEADLLKAAEAMDYDQMSKLLLRNVSPNCIIKTTGQTPLHIVCANKLHGSRSEGFVTLLVHYGADVSKTDSTKMTPLNYAEKNGFPSMVLEKLRAAIIPVDTAEEQLASSSRDGLFSDHHHRHDKKSGKSKSDRAPGAGAPAMRAAAAPVPPRR